MKTSNTQPKAGVSPDKEHNDKVGRISGSIMMHIPNLPQLLASGDEFYQRYNLLKNTLVKVDEENPWHDPDPESMHFICGDMQWGENYIGLYFRPIKQPGRQGQFHAYQKYVRKLCAEMDRTLSKTFKGDFRMTCTPSVTVEYFNEVTEDSCVQGANTTL